MTKKNTIHPRTSDGVVCVCLILFKVSTICGLMKIHYKLKHILVSKGLIVSLMHLRKTSSIRASLKTKQCVFLTALVYILPCLSNTNNLSEYPKVDFCCVCIKPIIRPSMCLQIFVDAFCDTLQASITRVFVFAQPLNPSHWLPRSPISATDALPLRQRRVHA